MNNLSKLQIDCVRSSHVRRPTSGTSCKCGNTCGPHGAAGQISTGFWPKCDDDLTKYNFAPGHNLEWMMVRLTFSWMVWPDCNFMGQGFMGTYWNAGGWVEMLFLALPWRTDVEDAQMFSFQIFPQTNTDSCLSLTSSLGKRREVWFHAQRYCFSQNSAKNTVFSK